MKHLQRCSVALYFRRSFLIFLESQTCSTIQGRVLLSLQIFQVVAQGQTCSTIQRRTLFPLKCFQLVPQGPPFQRLSVALDYRRCVFTIFAEATFFQRFSFVIYFRLSVFKPLRRAHLFQRSSVASVAVFQHFSQSQPFSTIECRTLFPLQLFQCLAEPTFFNDSLPHFISVEEPGANSRRQKRCTSSATLKRHRYATKG